MPTPQEQEKKCVVGWAGEPVLVIFARGLINRNLVDIREEFKSRESRFIIHLLNQLGN
ncbi:hypothetical protein E5S67_04038 [Microcoleus sp. IPMA8]|uniref:Uncharacterized protein n=1 Tax=Microcoleus asticus IPMA8 TaxID=2563858 RepID=A0ABX2D3P1_9CYAN|nr:hypothetical protein [Microcoleus asticus IPMA8]